jgi:hypothetical protein
MILTSLSDQSRDIDTESFTTGEKDSEAGDKEIIA